MGNAEGYRVMPAKCLFKNCFDVWQVRTIGVLRQPVATDDAIKLLLCTDLYFRTQHHGTYKCIEYRCELRNPGGASNVRTEILESSGS